ncbi:pseudouridine synthase pus4 [Elasticomyces elasticus]|uniref:tRNA pseudouridine(55) synthase n=1 Tax=Exophiala sideris TaxID=1016849 RepID=A0ABR0JIM5_9EURO|nr:pseudouridine synthase pus4 [Elasticomyces elasticus]KAK5034266.1 pseudouridine synthase pus4 [Exophiala sideris]KAK5042562.1 pseudouridine synthase pus4 [Exophiala sideris]KAK5065644.1 pseudouridine synthase pus4 [Exophiala sideris]KAK5185898.1 pseudouridine synthase pus4 [Eurotiomycetes sp. CCFEE 6388]
MAQPSGKAFEGVFAVSKPPHLSSAQVLRDLQHKFAESKTFAPLLQKTRSAQEEQERYQRKRRKRDGDQVFKMGHGGTLDPLATGILIVGIGRGTKHLSDFLACKKTYETVVLFGKNTDTYDVMGKVVAEAPTKHITEGLVEKQMEKFRGKHKQIPPIYSAIKIDGMKLYDYARSGKALPRQLESREVEISNCALLEYYGPGQHDFRWPAEQASDDEKAVAKRLMDGAEATKKSLAESEEAPPDKDAKRPGSPKNINNIPHQDKAALHTHHLPTQESSPANAPAASIRLTVSSGFYVRSFAYDLGVACGSYGTMAALVRSQQADFTISEPAPDGMATALTYEDLEAGEDIWGPKVSAVLEKWMEKHPAASTQDRIDDRDRRDARWNHPRRGGGMKRSWDDRSGHDDRSGARHRRNSSSPEI